MTILGPAARPCGSCPYRRDAPSGLWHRDEYAKLPAYDAPTGYQPAGVFLCHQQDGHMCAGWIGCHDPHHLLSLRIAAARHQVDDQAMKQAMEYVSPVPLFASGTEAAEHGLRDIEAPQARADQMRRRLRRKQINQRITQMEGPSQ